MGTQGPHHQHGPSCFVLAQFLLDGKVLSLTDFQVSSLGAPGIGWVWEDGKGVPGSGSFWEAAGEGLSLG